MRLFYSNAFSKKFTLTMTTFDETHYVPILKWRQGEYQALTKLDEAVKDRVTPLLEIPKETWDYENEKPSKSLDDHLSTFGKRLHSKWKDRNCFVDSCYIAGNKTMDDGTHHLERLFDLARGAGAKPIPIVGLSRTPAYVGSVKNIIAVDKRGLGLRLTDDDFNADLPNKLDKLVKALGVSKDAVHLIIDTGPKLGGDAAALASLWTQLLAQVPHKNSWATLTVAGSSFPLNLPSSTYRPHGIAPRCEWLAYKQVAINCKQSQTRVPTYGDYSCAAPNTSDLDPRMIDPNAKVKYTTTDSWFITLGMPVKANGRGQYQALCNRIVNHKPRVYSGRKFSFGDGYIADCDAGLGTGGSSTWPCVASNHHITMVTRDLSNYHAVSSTP